MQQGSEPGAPVSGDDPSTPDNPQQGYGHINIYMMNKYSIIAMFLLLIVSCDRLQKSELSSMDYDLFDDTKTETLAQAVKTGDTLAIIREVEKNKIPVDIRSRQNGTTLLMMATYHNNITSAKCLLTLGANPNLYDDTTRSYGDNSVLIAVRRRTPSAEMLKLLLDYGGDPNSQSKGVKYSNMRKYIPMRDFALQRAAAISLDKVKILIDAGADINKLGSSTQTSAIYTAMTHRKMDVLLFLLQNGADYSMQFCNRDSTSCENILDILRTITFPLNSKEHRQKMEVVAFLKKKGMDYAASPIPEYIISWAKKEYPQRWSEYLSKY